MSEIIQFSGFQLGNHFLEPEIAEVFEKYLPKNKTKYHTPTYTHTEKYVLRVKWRRVLNVNFFSSWLELNYLVSQYWVSYTGQKICWWLHENLEVRKVGQLLSLVSQITEVKLKKNSKTVHSNENQATTYLARNLVFYLCLLPWK